MDPYFNNNTKYILIAMIILTVIFMVFCKYQASTVMVEPLSTSPSPSRTQIKEHLIASPTERQQNTAKTPNKSCCLNDPKYTVLGYDNPYVFPYNYCLNLNHPTRRFNLPGWARRVQLAQKSSLGFPGFMY